MEYYILAEIVFGLSIFYFFLDKDDGTNPFS